MFTLRPFQKAALDTISSPGHLLCVAPTGSGKSLIYEMAAQQRGRRTLLVTPLVALARQQHARLSQRVLTRLGMGPQSEGPPPRRETGIWITSPERLQTDHGRAEVRSWHPDFLVVDECHCLWEWGESFRPAFRSVPDLLFELDIPTSLWLTATLPPNARTELKRRLTPLVIQELGAFDLPPQLELNIARVPGPDRAETLLGWILQQNVPGIVFTPTRMGTMRFMRLLQAAGREAIAYHAGMGAEERRALEARIALNLPDVVVATSAFGLGMDYPNLHWVALGQAPVSLLSFAQAIGRATRDPTRAARTLALWHEDDFRLLEWTLQGSASGTERRLNQLEEVRAYFALPQCRRTGLRNYFSGQSARNSDPDDPGCGICDFCRALGNRLV